MTIDLDSIIGKRFDRLIIKTAERLVKYREDGKVASTYIHCICLCDCGNFKPVRWSNLRSGSTASCGCLREELRGFNLKTHGLSHLKEHMIWTDMVNRCTNPDSKSFKNYGGRGITVSDSWLGSEGFVNFLNDMGRMPTDRFTIERVNVDLGYGPSNCIWTDDISLQSYNTSLRVHNTSGKTGVCKQHLKEGSFVWQAHICRNGKRLKKCFKSFEDACDQRDAWEIEF